MRRASAHTDRGLPGPQTPQQQGTSGEARGHKQKKIKQRQRKAINGPSTRPKRSPEPKRPPQAPNRTADTRGHQGRPEAQSEPAQNNQSTSGETREASKENKQKQRTPGRPAKPSRALQNTLPRARLPQPAFAGTWVNSAYVMMTAKSSFWPPCA